MKTSYLLYYVEPDDSMTFHDVIWASSMGEALEKAGKIKEEWLNRDHRWFVVHGYEVE